MLYKSYYEETDEIYSAIRRKSVVSMQMNNYALEEVVLGRLKPSEKVPFERYVEELNLYDENPFDIRGELLAGAVIDSNEQIVNRELEYFGDLFYTLHVKITFAREIFGDRFKKKENIAEYLRSLFPLFGEIMKTEIATMDYSENDTYKLAPNDFSVSHFLAAIKIKNLKKGADVSDYLKETENLSFFTEKLVSKKDDRYILENNDTESHIYKLALLCSLFFRRESNAKLFERKAIEWAKRNIKEA